MTAAPGYRLATPDRTVDRAAILAVFDAARTADPGYIVPVTRGLTTLESWFDRKQPSWCRVALADDDTVVGHVGVARTPVPHPLWGTLPPSATWELCRLVVHPDHRRRGLARALVTAAQDTFTHGLWGVPHRDGAMYHLCTALGWVPDESQQIRWSDDTAPGVFLTAPPTTCPIPRGH